MLMGSSRVEDSILADGVELQNSVVVQSEIGNGTTVGPLRICGRAARLAADARLAIL